MSISEGVFAENSNLEEITIKCPDLITISDYVDLSHLSMLRSLSFHGSGLQTIPENLVNYYDIQTLDLSSNPLNCDCNLAFLRQLLYQQNPVNLIGTCETPEKLSNTHLSRLSEDVSKMEKLK